VFSIQSRSNRGERDCALLLVLPDQGHDVGLILRRLLSPAIRKLRPAQTKPSLSIYEIGSSLPPPSG
jgi:hypothetical protein